MTAGELQQEFETLYAPLIEKGLGLSVMRNPVNGVYKPAELNEPVSPQTHCLDVWRPFIFDIRKMPKTFCGFAFTPTVSSGTIPFELRLDEDGLADYEDVWSEENITAYAQEHALDICEQLNDYTLTFEDILNIVALGDFEKHKRNLQQLKEENLNAPDADDDGFEDDWEEEEDTDV